MEQLYITDLTIKKVRHLKDILIPLSGNQIKHLILTGKNGSGKTSVIDAMAYHLDSVFTDKWFSFREQQLKDVQNQMDAAVQSQCGEVRILELESELRKRK